LRKAFLFTSSIIDFPRRFREEYRKTDLIIAVDGGANILYNNEIIPDFIIGDMDSASKNILAFFKDKTTINSYPKEKNETDTEIAVRFCLGKNIKDIIVFTSVSGRFDQLFGLISLLFLARDSSAFASLEDNSFQAFLAAKNQIVPGKSGELISLIPLSEKIENISTSGLKYNLKQEQLLRYKTRGISNIFSEDKAVISFEKGDLLVVKMFKTE